MVPNDVRMLIVDDVEALLEALKKHFSKEGFSNIHLATSAEQALQVLAAQSAKKEPIELIFSDWNMPGMSGLEFLKKVRAIEEHKKTPFIMVTAEGETGQIMSAIEAGVSNYIVKPLTPSTLKAKLEQVWKALKPRG